MKTITAETIDNLAEALEGLEYDVKYFQNLSNLWAEQSPKHADIHHLEMKSARNQKYGFLLALRYAGIEAEVKARLLDKTKQL